MGVYTYMFCCIQPLSFSELSVSSLKHYGTDKQSIKSVQIIGERRKIIQTEHYIGPRGIKRDKTTRFLKLFWSKPNTRSHPRYGSEMNKETYDSVAP
jgi:hypothetical protein